MTADNTPPRRSISTRTWVIIALTSVFFALTAAQYLAGRQLNSQGFEEAENADLLSRARHVQALLAAARTALLNTADDYAVWDVTVNFASGKPGTYTTDNWQFETLNRFAIETVAIVDASDRPLLARAIDWQNRGQSELTPDHPLIRAARNGGGVRALLSDDASRSGYLVVGGAVYLWAGAPIRLSGEQRKSDGQLVIYRRLDTSFADAVGEAVGARLQFAMNAGSQPLPQMPAQTSDLRFNRTSGESADARFALAHFPGQQQLTAQLTAPRPIVATVARTNQYTLLSNLGIGIVLAMIAVLLLNARLLRPLEKLASQLRGIGATDDRAQRVLVPARQDEIAAVVDAINRMLATIDSKRDAEAARDAAIAASKLKSEFLAVMSHEIRTPMNGVLGMLDLLANSPLTREQQQRVHVAQQSAAALLDLLNSILDLSRLEAGRMTVDNHPVDIRGLLLQTGELFQARAADKGLTLSFTQDGQPAEAYVTDGGKLRQIVNNLAGNAVKFTATGGVSLHLSCTAHDARTDQVRIDVRDTGIGISAEKLQSIFEPFVQEDSGITRRFGGSGLGLSISQRLAGLLGMRLTVASEPGKGTCFTLRGELERAARPAAVAPATAATAPVNRELSVLVAEDNVVNQTLVRAVLDHLGYRYVIVGDGADAVERYSAAPGEFHAILMDVNMPRLDGLAATRRIREFERARGNSRVLIVGITASAMVGDRDQCLQAGMDHYIAKPYRLADIAALLGTLRPDA